MRLRNGWRAGYAEMCKSGSEGGSRKPDLEIDQGGGFLPNKVARAPVFGRFSPRAVLKHAPGELSVVGCAVPLPVEPTHRDRLREINPLWRLAEPHRRRSPPFWSS